MTDDKDFTIWCSEQDNSPACTPAPGVLLCTKDGTKQGNAIVVKQIGDTRKWGRVPVEIEPVWLVETDFGNHMNLSSTEVLTLFTLGRVTDYEKWWDDRLDTIHKTI